MAFLQESGDKKYFFLDRYVGSQRHLKEWVCITRDNFATLTTPGYFSSMTNPVPVPGDIIRVKEVTDREDLSTVVHTYLLFVKNWALGTFILLGGGGGLDTPALVDSIATLRTLTPGVVPAVQVVGYYGNGTKGGGLFYWSALASNTDDGGLYIQANAGGVGRWIRIYANYLSTSDFGVRDDATVTYTGGNKQGFAGIDATESAFNGTDNNATLSKAINTCGSLNIPLKFVGHMRIKIASSGDTILCSQGWHHFFADEGGAWVYLDCQGYTGALIYAFDTGASSTFNRTLYQRFVVSNIVFKGRWQQYLMADKTGRYLCPFRIEGFALERFDHCEFYDIRDKAVRAAYCDQSEEFASKYERCASGGHRAVHCGKIIRDGFRVKNCGDDSMDSPTVDNADLICDTSLQVINGYVEDGYALNCIGGQALTIANVTFKRCKERCLAVGTSTATKGDTATRTYVIANILIEDPIKQCTFVDLVHYDNALALADANDAPIRIGGSRRSGASNLLSTPQAVTLATAANPCVITYSGADNFTNGDKVFITGIADNTVDPLVDISFANLINARAFTVANVNAGANTLELSGFDATAVNLAFPTSPSATIARCIYPGDYNPVTDAFVDIYALTGPHSISATHTNDGNTISNCAGGEWSLTNITVSRTLDNVSAYSLWGYGQMYTKTGWKDPAVADTSFLRNGFTFNADGKNIILDNPIVRGLRTGAFIYFRAQHSDVESSAFGRIIIKGGITEDMLWGIKHAGSATVHWPIEIEGHTFDLDPQLKSANRKTATKDGTWLSAGIGTNFAAFDMPGWRGGVVRDCTFKNLYRVYANSEPTYNIFRNNLLVCKPGANALGYNAAHVGIATLEAAGDQFHYSTWDGNPQNFRTTFDQLLNRCLSESTGAPASGTYVTNDFVSESAAFTGAGRRIRGYHRRATGAVTGVLWTDFTPDVSGAEGYETQGDADKTLTPGTNAVNQLFNTTLTANRTVTLAQASGGSIKGDRFTLARSALGVFTLIIVDQASSATLYTMPAGIQDSATFVFDGTNWQVMRYLPQPLRIRKTADQTVASNNVLFTDSALQFALAASTKYAISLKVWFDTGATADFQYALTGPAIGAGLIRVVRKHIDPTNLTTLVTGSDVAYTTAQALNAGAGTTGGYVEMDILLQNGASAGTFGFQWAQNSSFAENTTVRAGSYLEYMLT